MFIQTEETPNPATMKFLPAFISMQKRDKRMAHALKSGF